MTSGNRPQARIYPDGTVEVWRDGHWQEAHVTYVEPRPEPEQAYGEYHELFMDLYTPRRRVSGGGPALVVEGQEAPRKQGR